MEMKNFGNQKASTNRQKDAFPFGMAMREANGGDAQ
jgi:hypothetical protein